ncbi:uncharacterized protein [Choristoneura fumiferana]|uniref:uncharacterized protein n=1 Tax=Choristoneura fumiferana TaxID=7141 RepID=UPI003D154AFD
MTESEKVSLAQLVVARGHAKGSITRLLNYSEKRALALELAEPAIAAPKVQFERPAMNSRPTWKAATVAAAPMAEPDLAASSEMEHTARPGSATASEKPCAFSKVKLICQNGKEIQVRALLDTGSQVSFITDNTLKILGYIPVRNETSIIGITHAENKTHFSVRLEVHSNAYPFSLPVECHVVDKITMNLPQNMIDMTTLNLPPSLKLADDTFNAPGDIQMLMGADIFFQILLPTQTEPPRQPASAAQSPPSPPCIINTLFGHIVADSQVVLSWIKTDLTKLDTYVANRVKVILQHSAQHKWLYVRSADNPADCLSREFQVEMKALRANKQIKGSLQGLHVFIDKIGTLRVGGRLQNAMIPLKAVAAKQLMGSLPSDRVNPSRPFEKVGVDYCGPISIKQSRGMLSLMFMHSTNISTASMKDSILSALALPRPSKRAVHLAMFPVATAMDGEGAGGVASR